MSTQQEITDLGIPESAQSTAQESELSPTISTAVPATQLSISSNKQSAFPAPPNSSEALETESSTASATELPATSAVELSAASAVELTAASAAELSTASATELSIASATELSIASGTELFAASGAELTSLGELPNAAPASEQIAQFENKPGELRERFSQFRNAASLIIFVSAAAVWFLSFGRLDVGQEGLPWYIILGLISASTVRFLKFDSYENLPLVGLPRSSEPLKLRESLAIVFLVVAVGMYMAAGYQLLHSFDRDRSKIIQVVDIQLLSEKDYRNNNELLPGMKEYEKLRKRTADTITQKGELTPSSAVQSPESVATKEVKQDKNIKNKTESKETKPTEDPEETVSKSAKSAKNEKNKKPNKSEKAPEQKEVEQKITEKKVTDRKAQERNERKTAIENDPNSSNKLSKNLSNKANKDRIHDAVKQVAKVQDEPPLPVVSPLFSKPDHSTDASKNLGKLAAANVKPIATAANASSALAIPHSWQTKSVDNVIPVVAKATPQASQQSRSQLPFLTEVKPLEMVELIENEGDSDGIHVYQKGGKSSGGKGAENNLNIYLKDLHKRIKSNWAPPRGFTRQVEVLFRLRRDGHVAFIKIVKSSSEPAADASAAKAVSLATKKGSPLPVDFAADNLDVMYTFKYNVDELQEVQSVSEEN